MIGKSSFGVEDKFNKYLSLAVIFHAGILLFIFTLNTVLKLDLFRKDEVPKNLKLIQSSVRVDIVAMPKFTVQELKKMKVAPVAKEVKAEVSKKEAEDVIKPGDVVIKKAKKKINLKNLLSNLSKKENKKLKKKNKNKKNSKGKINQKQRELLNKLILEGNHVSSGSSLVGDNSSEASSKFNQYVQNLSNLVRPHWKLPSYLIEKNLKCRIRIYIAANGKILDKKIYESSGVSEFDQRALAAVESVSILPKPDGEIISKLAAGEAVLGFPL